MFPLSLFTRIKHLHKPHLIFSQNINLLLSCSANKLLILCCHKEKLYSMPLHLIQSFIKSLLSICDVLGNVVHIVQLAKQVIGCRLGKHNFSAEITITTITLNEFYHNFSCTVYVCAYALDLESYTTVNSANLDKFHYLKRMLFHMLTSLDFIFIPAKWKKTLKFHGEQR